jgi:tetratricopeptide (TPR) repeat protein
VRSYELIEPTTHREQQLLSTIAGNIGAAYYELGEPEEALRWYRRDLSLSLAMSDQAGTAATRHNIGHVLLEMGTLQGALAEFRLARETYARLGMDDLVAEEDESIAHASSLLSSQTVGSAT